MVSIWGRLSDENMLNIIKDFSQRPETASLVSPLKGPNNVGEAFFSGVNGKQDIMMIEQKDESDNDGD